MESEHPVRLGPARGDEAHSRVRLWRGTRLADAGVDEGPRFPADGPGEPEEMSPVRITAGAAGIQCAARNQASESIKDGPTYWKSGYAIAWWTCASLAIGAHVHTRRRDL